jgi:hypothetical protein
MLTASALVAVPSPLKLSLPQMFVGDRGAQCCARRVHCTLLPEFLLRFIAWIRSGSYIAMPSPAMNA